MTPEQIRLVSEVVAQVAESEDFATRFYDRLFEVAPQVAVLFDDVSAQRRKLTDELGAMVALLGDLGSLEARATELGERHRGYGVRAAHYRVARQVMVESLELELGERFGPAEHEAWNRATSLITELMQTV